MTDDELLGVVRDAVIAAKGDVVILYPGDITADSVLAESPIVLDSLEFVEMVTRIEVALGLSAIDDHLRPRSMRTTADVMAAARQWLAAERTLP